MQYNHSTLKKLKKKLDGIDTRIADFIQNQEIVRRYSEPGEIKAYFQNELSKEEEEIEIRNKKEEELSFLAIQTFKDQEEEEIKKQIQLDEELAKSLISQDKIEATRKEIQLNKGVANAVAKSSLLTSSRVTRCGKRKSRVHQKVVTSTPKRKIINYFRSTSQSPSLPNLSTSFNSSISETAISPSTSTVNFLEDSDSNVTEISINSLNNSTTVENDENNLESTEYVKLQMAEFERAKRLAEQLKEDELLAKSLMEEENKLNRKRIYSRDYPLRPTSKRQKTGKKLEIKRGKKLGKDSVVIKGQHIICKDASGNICFNNP
uniref:Uncharacterized protein n=1 Tax=Clastoptera arizonana TaxID=38151 RepID=A0A1B6C9Y8_9HEMI